MDVSQIGGKNLVYIVELHVKLRIKIVEMRAKSVSWVKICSFDLSNHDQKTREFRQPSESPRGQFFCLNWVQPSHLKFALNIFTIRIQKSITRRSRSHRF